MAASRTDYLFPLPAGLGRTREFYDFLKRHELRFQKCADCPAWRHPPREMCARCGSTRWQWTTSSGRGRVFSWTTVTQPALAQFAVIAPYSPAVIEMD
ncbi:MAG: Zn-ribbon domain-containing OB-fold protein, partial [Candidatus Binataceae bacterium]